MRCRCVEVGADDSMQEKSKEGYAMIEVHPEGCVYGSGLDITINSRNMRSKFGYIEVVQQLLSATNYLPFFRFKAPICLLFIWILYYWTASIAMSKICAAFAERSPRSFCLSGGGAMPLDRLVSPSAEFVISLRCKQKVCFATFIYKSYHVKVKSNRM